MSEIQRERIIRTDPIQIDIKFPLNENERSFSTSYYTKQMPNGENIKRDWIVYSRKLDAILCFYCYIFEQNRENSHQQNR